MCVYVPGQVLAIGPIPVLFGLQSKNLPGSLSLRGMIHEEGEIDSDSPFMGMGIAVLQTDPGLEIYCLSRLSALLAPHILSGSCAVDFNHYLPLGTTPRKPYSLNFSPIADKFIGGLRSALECAWYRSQQFSGDAPRCVAILDTGLDPSAKLRRPVKYYDYSHDELVQLDAPHTDPLGHGTQVIKILDEILPEEIELVAGRLPTEHHRATTLTVAHAMGDLVARSVPDVVNLSFALMDQTFICSSCRRRISVPGFLPNLLSVIFRLAEKSRTSTAVVVAAGNEGQVSNSRLLHSDINNLLLAVADNQRGERARYSGFSTGPLADSFSASAFGGDDPGDPDAMGVFDDGTHGTSFAAPFLTSAAVLRKYLLGSGPVDSAILAQDVLSSEIGRATQMLIDFVRDGRTLQWTEPWT